MSDVVVPLVPEVFPPAHPLSITASNWCCEHLKDGKYVQACVLYKGDSLCEECYKKIKK